MNSSLRIILSIFLLITCFTGNSGLLLAISLNQSDSIPDNCCCCPPQHPSFPNSSITDQKEDCTVPESGSARTYSVAANDSCSCSFEQAPEVPLQGYPSAALTLQVINKLLVGLPQTVRFIQQPFGKDTREDHSEPSISPQLIAIHTVVLRI
ncbi:MAG: hypothetical protein ACOX5R_14850 [bacterium]|jgi:hypothetical protein